MLLFGLVGSISVMGASDAASVLWRTPAQIPKSLAAVCGDRGGFAGLWRNQALPISFFRRRSRLARASVPRPEPNSKAAGGSGV